MARSIDQTADGGFIVFGQTQSSDGQVSGNHGGQLGDYWAVRLTQQVRCFGNGAWVVRIPTWVLLSSKPPTRAMCLQAAPNPRMATLRAAMEGTMRGSSSLARTMWGH